MGTSHAGDGWRTALERLSQAADLVHPRTLVRLEQAGAFQPRRTLAGLRVLPWLLGRGASLGVASQLQAYAQPDRTAVIDRRGTLTWRELDRRANRLARALLALGVEPGDQIATLLRNGAEQVETILAAQKAGIVVAPLNTWSRAAELDTVLHRSVPAAVVYDTRHRDQLADAAPRTVPLVAVGDTDAAIDGSEVYADLVADHDGDPLAPITSRRGSAEIIIHTSGTTGVPKAAARDASSAAVPAVASLLRVVPYRHDDVMFLPAPLFHSFGLMSLTAAMLIGMPTVLPDTFDAEEALAAIERHGATVASVVPVMIRRILNLPDDVRSRHDLSGLRILLASGSSMSPGMRRDAMRVFGHVLYDLYGSTEAGWVAIATPHDIASRPNAVGRPSPGVDVAIFSADGERLPRGETGVIHARGGAQFAGYRSGEEADERAGYLDLGDLGRVDDDGYLHVEGRADDMVVIGGENVYPIEVEGVVEQVGGVTEAAVLGVPDEEYGEVLAAFVVGDVSVDDVRAACEKQLASFKVPRRITVVDELPRTATGKVLRGELRERAVPS